MPAAGCSSGRHDGRAACASRDLGVFAISQGGGGAIVGEFQLRLQLPADGGRIAVKFGIGRPRRDEPKADSTLTVSTFGRAT